MSDVRHVLDASALLAVMLGERGADVVAACLDDACISAVNLSEAVAKLAERGVPAAVIGETLADLALDVRSFDDEQALRAGYLRPLTRGKGLSLGDRACLALAQQLQAIAVTMDAAWSEIDHGIAIRLAR